MNSSTKVEKISLSVLMEKEDVEEVECKEESEIVHSMWEQLEEKHESANVIKELLWSSNDEEFGDEDLMQLSRSKRINIQDGGIRDDDQDGRGVPKIEDKRVGAEGECEEYHHRL